MLFCLEVIKHLLLSKISLKRECCHGAHIVIEREMGEVQGRSCAFLNALSKKKKLFIQILPVNK